MKCPTCHAVCADSDPRCYSCGTPMRAMRAAAASDGGPASRVPKVLSMLGMCIGMIAGPAVLGSSKSPPKQGVDFKQATHAGIGSAVCGTFGLVMGNLLCGARRPD